MSHLQRKRNYAHKQKEIHSKKLLLEKTLFQAPKVSVRDQIEYNYGLQQSNYFTVLKHFILSNLLKIMNPSHININVSLVKHGTWIKFHLPRDNLSDFYVRQEDVVEAVKNTLSFLIFLKRRFESVNDTKFIFDLEKLLIPPNLHQLLYIITDFLYEEKKVLGYQKFFLSDTDNRTIVKYVGKI